MLCKGEMHQVVYIFRNVFKQYVDVEVDMAECSIMILAGLRAISTTTEG